MPFHAADPNIKSYVASGSEPATPKKAKASYANH